MIWAVHCAGIAVCASGDQGIQVKTAGTRREWGARVLSECMSEGCCTAETDSLV